MVTETQKYDVNMLAKRKMYVSLEYILSHGPVGKVTVLQGYMVIKPGALGDEGDVTFSN